MAKGENADEVRRRIIERIMRLCQDKKFSQSELARSLSVSRQTVGKWFTQREQVPNEANLLELAALLETSVSYLYGETDDPRTAPDWYSDKGPVSAGEAAREEVLQLLNTAVQKLKGERDSK